MQHQMVTTETRPSRAQIAPAALELLSRHSAGLLATEYSCGVVLRRVLGEAPWDYSYARRHISGLVRPDYFPLWGAFGLALEPVHDILTGRRPA